MTKLDAVRKTVEEIGEASPVELVRQVQERFAITIPVAFVPVFLATIRATPDGGRSAQRIPDSEPVPSPQPPAGPD